jgi:diadenosine tetraphosphate (Ap4A) HIT family hydrolase
MHFHIIPRFSGDGFMKEWPAKQYDDPEKMKDLCDSIRQKLNQ